MYDIYRQLARDLGLVLTPADPGMMTFVVDLQGNVDGHPVQASRYCGRGAHVVVRSPLVPPLDLGLNVTRTGLLSTVADWFGAEDVTVGDETFDAAFTIRADEPARVRALLDAEVRRALASLRFPDLQLTDEHFECGFPARAESYDALTRAMHEVVRVVRDVDRARKAVAPATALAGHARAWMDFARGAGLSGEAAPLWMQGRLGDAIVAARAVRRGKSDFGLEVRVYLEPPLGTRLEVAPRRAKRPWAPFADPPLSTGDAAFDEAFEVKASQPERVPALLDLEVRRLLLDLHARTGPVFLRDQSVVAHPPAAAIDPARIPGIVDEMREVVDAIAQAALRAASMSTAYR